MCLTPNRSNKSLCKTSSLRLSLNRAILAVSVSICVTQSSKQQPMQVRAAHRQSNMESLLQEALRFWEWILLLKTTGLKPRSCRTTPSSRHSSGTLRGLCTRRCRMLSTGTVAPGLKEVATTSMTTCMTLWSRTKLIKTSTSLLSLSRSAQSSETTKNGKKIQTWSRISRLKSLSGIWSKIKGRSNLKLGDWRKTWLKVLSLWIAWVSWTRQPRN